MLVTAALLAIAAPAASGKRTDAGEAVPVAGTGKGKKGAELVAAKPKTDIDTTKPVDPIAAAAVLPTLPPVAAPAATPAPVPAKAPTAVPVAETPPTPERRTNVDAEEPSRHQRARPVPRQHGNKPRGPGGASPQWFSPQWFSPQWFSPQWESCERTGG